MAVTVTNIGTNTGSTVATVVVTVGAAGVPKNAVIFVCVADSSVSALGGGVADTGGNTYTRIAGADNNASTVNGFGAMFTAPVTTALVNGNSITYTLALTANAAVTAFYAGTINSAVAVAQTLAGSSTTPSVTGASGTASFLVGAVSMTGGSGDTFTQDSTNAAWTTPPLRVGLAGGPTIAGGSVTFNSVTASPIYAPTLGTTHPWACMLAQFSIPQPAYTPTPQLGPILAQ